MSREKEFVKNSIVLSFGTVVPKLASIVTLPIITSCLTKAEYGTYDLITVLVSLILPVATLQMQAAAFRFLLKVKGDVKKQKRVITNITLFTIPVSIIVLFIFYWVLNLSSITRLLVTLYFFVDIILNTFKQIARGLGHNEVYSIGTIINSFVEMLLTALLLLGLDKGLNGVLISMASSQICAILFVTIKIRLLSYIDIRLFSISKIKEMIAYSWPMIPNSLSSWVMRLSDRLILTWVLGVEANAVYAVANKLPNIFSLFQSSFSLAWQENATVAVKDDDSSRYYGKMFEDIFDVLVGFMAILIAFTPIIFKILIRGDYDDAYNHMPILYLAVMFAAISSFLGGIYIAHMRSRDIGITTTIAAGINFVFNIIFVRVIGIYAASLSTLISYMILSGYRMIDVQKFQKISFNYKKIIIELIILSLFSFACFMRITLIDIINMIASLIVAYLINRHLVNMIIDKAVMKIKKRN